MKGIKKHTHADRQRIIKTMTPLVKKKFGDNLVAFAACGSYARNEDANYSDLELMAFVKKMPRGKTFCGVAKLYDGMLIELSWMTRELYIKNVLEPNEEWFMSGSDVLLPIINRKFIEELNGYEVKNLKQKCLDHAVGEFAPFQESITKVMNAIGQKNREAIPVLVYYLLENILKLLAFLNQTPYVTASKFISQARGFSIKPASLDEMFDIIVDGRFTDLQRLRKACIELFLEFERMLEGLGLDLYDDNFDPNKPVPRMRQA